MYECNAYAFVWKFLIDIQPIFLSVITIYTYSELASFGSSTVPGQLEKKIFGFPEWFSIAIF